VQEIHQKKKEGTGLIRERGPNNGYFSINGGVGKKNGLGGDPKKEAMGRKSCAKTTFGGRA